MRKETLHERVIIIGGQQILPYVVGDSAYLILTSSWPVVIKMPKNLANTWKKIIGCWRVQLNGNKFATGQILEKPVEVVKGANFTWLSSKVSRTMKVINRFYLKSNLLACERAMGASLVPSHCRT